MHTTVDYSSASHLEPLILSPLLAPSDILLYIFTVVAPLSLIEQSALSSACKYICAIYGLCACVSAQPQLKGPAPALRLWDQARPASLTSHSERHLIHRLLRQRPLRPAVSPHYYDIPPLHAHCITIPFDTLSRLQLFTRRTALRIDKAHELHHRPRPSPRVHLLTGRLQPLCHRANNQQIHSTSPALSPPLADQHLLPSSPHISTPPAGLHEQRHGSHLSRLARKEGRLEP